MSSRTWWWRWWPAGVTLKSMGSKCRATVAFAVVKKLSISLDESVAERAASAAASHGVSLSAWLNAAAERAIRVEDGLAAVREWEQEHGELSTEELAWADKVIASDLRA